jgi:DegV family protein with EDD domain
MKTVNIITDTTACLPHEVALRHNIPVIPQIINFGDESFYEGTEIDIRTFLDKLRRSSELPKTAAPPPELFAMEFRSMVKEGLPILCIHPSSEVSGTVRSATIASKDFPEANTYIIDTRVIASPLGTMVQLAAEWSEEGKSLETISSKLEDLIDRCRIYFLVDTLEFLARGGRIGGASALLGSMLRIKPILTFNHGKVDQCERERTHKRALNRLKQIVLDQIPHDGTGHLSIMHADTPEQARILAAELGAAINQPYVRIAEMPPAIITHGGPGVLGVGFFSKT